MSLDPGFTPPMGLPPAPDPRRFNEQAAWAHVRRQQELYAVSMMQQAEADRAAALEASDDADDEFLLLGA